MSLPLDYSGSGLPPSPYPEYKHPFIVLAYDDLLEDNEKRDYTAKPQRLLKKRDVRQSGMKGKPIDIQHKEIDKVGVFHDYKITGKNLWARGYASDRGHQWIKNNETIPDPLNPGQVRKRRIGFSISFDSPKKKFADENVQCDVVGGAFCVDPVRMRCFVRTDYSRGSNDDYSEGEEIDEENVVVQKSEKDIKKKMRVQFSTQAQVDFATPQEMSTPDNTVVDAKVTVPIDPNAQVDPNATKTPVVVVDTLPAKTSEVVPPKTSDPTGLSIPSFDFTKPEETKKNMGDYFSKLSPELQKTYMDQLFDASLSGAKMQHEQGVKERSSHMETLKGLSTELPDWNEEEYAKEYDNGIRHERLIKMAQAQRAKSDEFKKKEKEMQSLEKKNGKQPSNNSTPVKTPDSKSSSSAPMDPTALNRKQSEISTMFQDMLKSRTPKVQVPENKYFPTPQAIRNHYSNDRQTKDEVIVEDKEPSKKPEKRERDGEEVVEKKTKGETKRMLFGNNNRLEQIMNTEIDMHNLGVDNKKQFHELWHDIKLSEKIALRTGKDDMEYLASTQVSVNPKRNDQFNSSNFIEE